MADLNFFQKWLMRRLEDAERIAAEESPYKPSRRLELPPLDPTDEKPRYGLCSAIVS